MPGNILLMGVGSTWVEGVLGNSDSSTVSDSVAMYVLSDVGKSDSVSVDSSVSLSVS